MCVIYGRDSDSKSTLTLSLHCPDSEPPGIIINLIIKHLLPTAPALSLLCGPPGPHHKRSREREREGERERRKAVEGGGTQEEPEGGVGEREESSKSKGVIITLLDSFTPARGRFFVWWQTACEVM